VTERHVLTIGTFDMFHQGHYNILQFCQDLASPGCLTIGVNSERFVKDFKGEWPTNPLESRMASCRAFGDVIENDGRGSELIQYWHRRTAMIANEAMWLPFVVVGSDFARQDYYARVCMTPDEFDELGISLVYRPYTQDVSSTILKTEYIARQANAATSPSS
jgi:glycerol-3-phosphate cytidylyltransferase